MLMFILGAISWYVISSIMAFILELTNIVDFWTFGNVYFSIPFYPFLPFVKIIRKIRKNRNLTKKEI